MREFDLVEELIDISGIFDRAFKELKSLDFKNEHYFSMFRLFSEGLERLFKISLALCYWDNQDKIKKKIGNTHDLEQLLERVINCGIEKEELNQIRTDDIFKRVLSVLTKFAKIGRYHNLDIIAGDEKLYGSDSPRAIWEGIESDIQNNLPDYKRKLEKILSQRKKSTSTDEYKKIQKKEEKLINESYHKSSAIIEMKLKKLINEICDSILKLQTKEVNLNEVYIEKIKR